jgi:transposase-like protein
MRFFSENSMRVDRNSTTEKSDTYAGHSAEIKQQIVDMAMNASGIRDTARVLHVSPTTVIKELKKKSRSCSQ